MSTLDNYKELYHYDGKRSLVMNKITSEVCVKKVLEHFDTELYLNLKRSGSDFLPKIYEVFETSGKLIVIEEFIQGSTFDSLISDRNMPVKTKLGYFTRLCDALGTLHSMTPPVIHRDLKPSNIMLRGEDLYIIDFDSSRLYDPTASGDTSCLGTEGVAAPEQYGFMQSDPRTDIYAVGMMLKEAFPDDHRIQKIAAKATEFDPNRRYQSVEELKAVLLNRLTPVMVLHLLFPPPGFRTMKIWKMAIALLVYALASYISISIQNENGDPKNIVFKLMMFLSFMSVIDVYTDWTGLYESLPLLHHESIIVRLLLKTVYAFIVIVVMMSLTILLGGIVDNLLL